MHEKFKGVSLAIRRPHNLGNLGEDRLSPVMSALSTADIRLRDRNYILTHTQAHAHYICICARPQKERAPKRVNNCKDAALSSTS